MKEIVGNKIVSNATLPNLSRWKTEIFDKKEITETFNSYFVNVGPNLVASIPESKTSFQNYIHNDGTISLTGLRLENAFVSLKTKNVQGMMIYLPMLSKECPMKYLLF